MKNLQSLLSKRLKRPSEKPKHRIDFDFQALGIELEEYMIQKPADETEKEKKRYRSDRARLWRLFYQYELPMIHWAYSSCKDRGKPFLGYFIFLLQMEQWRIDSQWYREMYAKGEFDALRERFEPRRHLYSKKDTAPMIEALAKVAKG